MLICKECGKSHKEYYYLASGPFGVGEILCQGCWEKYLKVEGDREYRVRMLWAERQQFQKQWEREHNKDIYCCRDPKWEQLQITLRSFMRGKKYDYTRLRNARLITESQSHYFETVTLPAEQEAVRKAKEERLRAEQEAEKKRIAEEKERKKKEEEERKRKEEEFERNAKASAVIQSVRVEYDVSVGDEFGMQILVDCQINYMRNKKGQIAAYFYLKKNNNYTKLLDCNKKYYSSDGQVSTWLNILPTLPQQQYNNLALFIPYDEMHLPKGKSELNFNVEIFNNLNTSIARSEYYNFRVNMYRASLLGVHKLSPEEQNQSPNMYRASLPGVHKQNKNGCLKTMLILFFVVSIGCIIFMFGGIMLGL